MKIDVISDLHMEFRSYEINSSGVDTLVIAGDAIVTEDIKRYPMNDSSRPVSTGSHREWNSEIYQEFFESVSKQYKNVIYVPGNHEYYGSVFQEVDDIMERELSHWSNIHYLNANVTNIDGVVFVGVTLWTDFWRSALAMGDARQCMNDYRKIRWKTSGYRKLRPEDILRVHSHHLQTIQNVVASSERNGQRCVIVTHHAPSKRSIAQGFENSKLNAAYVNQLDEMISDWVNVPLWIHGHVHQKLDYNIGLTRVVCNPMGYPGELKSQKVLTIEI